MRLQKAHGKLASINERKSGKRTGTLSARFGRALSSNFVDTEVTLTVPFPTAILLEVSSKPDKSRKKSRAPRIRVPNNERAIFIVDESKFVGVIQRLSLTGGSAVLAKGPIARGAMGEMILNTVFGRVTAQIEFLQTNADGIPLAQAFRFLAMDDDSSRRFSAAASQMEKEGFSDASPKASPLSGNAPLGQLLRSVRRLAATLSNTRS